MEIKTKFDIGDKIYIDTVKNDYPEIEEDEILEIKITVKKNKTTELYKTKKKDDYLDISKLEKNVSKIKSEHINFYKDKIDKINKKWQ